MTLDELPAGSAAFIDANIFVYHFTGDHPEHLWFRRLRGKRTQSQFAALIGTAPNTVSRWEVGRVGPGAEQLRRLSELAEKEHFLEDWKLAGSGILAGDLDRALRELAERARKGFERGVVQSFGD